MKNISATAIEESEFSVSGNIKKTKGVPMIPDSPVKRAAMAKQGIVEQHHDKSRDARRKLAWEPKED